MSESFKKLKKKTLLAVILKSIIIGLSAGLFVAGVLLLAFQLSSIELHWALYVVIGVSVALIAGANSLLFMFPNDMKIARKYDAEYGFNEKLQTLVAFEGQEGDIVSIQREDALEKLGNAPALKIKFSRIWYYILIGVVALAMFFSAVFIPAAAQSGVETPPDDITDTPVIDDPEKDDKVFEFDLAMQSAMGDLIDEIRDSGLQEDVKTVAVSELEALRTNLKEIKLQSEMVTAVYAAVSAIDEAIENSNSFRKISSEVSDFDANLSQAIIKGFVIYKSRLTSSLNIDYVNALRTGIGDYIEDAMEELVAEAAEALKVSRISLDGEKPLGEVLGDYTLSLDGALTISGIGEDDALYKSLNTLSQSLKVIKTQADRPGTPDSTLWGYIDENYGIMQRNAVSSLSVQNYKCIVEAYIRQSLTEILGVSFNGLIELYADLIYEAGGEQPPIDPDDPDNPGDISGGIGTGNIVFGSDDLIYYPKTGTFEKFGTVLSEYETAITNGTLAEDFPESLKNYLEAYLNYLHKGTGDPDKAEN